jgi:hypothetical protein
MRRAGRSTAPSITFAWIGDTSARFLAAGEDVYSELINLCVWNKSNAGMGSLYRSKHELIFVFKVGKGAHINNVALGRYGRHRTNVWDYVSQNALSGTAKCKLALHPTVKPVAMVADAICDCSNRGGLILDPFRGRRDDPDCGGADWPPCSRDRAQPDLCRRQHRALAATDRQHCAPCRQRAAVLAVWQRSGGRYWRVKIMSRRKTTASTGDGRKGYEVGYGKPPTHTQYRPGQSGYPAGRRKGVRNLKTDVKRTLAMPVKVTEGGRTRTRSTQEAALMVLREKALKGNTRALERIVELAFRFNNDEAGLAQQLPANDQAILAAYVAQFKAAAMTSTTGALADDPASKPGPRSGRKARK